MLRTFYCNPFRECTYLLSDSEGRTLVVPGRCQHKSSRELGLPWRGEASPIQEENLLLQGGPGGAAPPRPVFVCSVYSASRLRTRKQRARRPAQLAAWPWAAAAGLTALHADAAPGGPEDSRHSHGLAGNCVQSSSARPEGLFFVIHYLQTMK